MPCRKPTAGILAHLWRWRRWPMCYGSATCGTIRAIRSGQIATALCFPLGTPPCCCIPCCTAPAFSDDVAARFMAYHWNVQRVGDANDLTLLDEAIKNALQETTRPSLIIVDSHIAWGAPHKHDTSAAHGEPLGEEEIRLTKARYGWPVDAQFLVPEEVRQHMGEAADRGAKAEVAWNQKFAAYKQKYPELATEWEQISRRELPKGWDG